MAVSCCERCLRGRRRARCRHHAGDSRLGERAPAQSSKPRGGHAIILARRDPDVRSAGLDLLLAPLGHVVVARVLDFDAHAAFVEDNLGPPAASGELESLERAPQVVGQRCRVRALLDDGLPPLGWRARWRDQEVALDLGRTQVVVCPAEIGAGEGVDAEYDAVLH